MMAEQSSAQIREQIFLQWLTGPLAGQKINLSIQRLTIGRDPAFCNVVADWEGVSRQHATVEIAQHDSIIITDAGSKAGTFVNGEAVSRRILRAGDVIALGSP